MTKGDSEHRRGRRAATITRLRLSNDTESHVVPVAEIDMLVAETGRVRIYRGQHVYVTVGSLAELSRRLGPAFVRVSASTIVNSNRISACADRPDGSMQLQVGTQEVSIPHSYAAVLRAISAIEGTSARGDPDVSKS